MIIQGNGRRDAVADRADVVVVAVDPRRVPALAEHVKRTMPALPPVVCHLGLTGAAVTGDVLARAMHGEPPGLDLAPFSAARF